ncbi:hypothetical protein B0H14DRAFT_2610943 [Mycena olivaceomarginata]|nr:hypothetical protein B0H14DRAFT_2610943 [Mycena olivaceomarginata]
MSSNSCQNFDQKPVVNSLLKGERLSVVALMITSRISTTIQVNKIDERYVIRPDKVDDYMVLIVKLNMGTSCGCPAESLTAKGRMASGQNGDTLIHTWECHPPAPGIFQPIPRERLRTSADIQWPEWGASLYDYAHMGIPPSNTRNIESNTKGNG